MLPVASPSSTSRRSMPAALLILIGSAVGACLACIVLGFFAWRSISNSPLLQAAIESTEFITAEQPNLATLQERLLAAYPSESVVAYITWPETGVPPDVPYTLAITFKKPRFEVPIESDQQQALARSIATDVAATYPQVNRFQFVSITFAGVAPGAALSADWTYRFPIEDIVP